MDCNNVEKDRTPEFAGNRSFFKIGLYIVALCIAGGFWFYANQLVLVIKPENNQTPICFTTFVGDKLEYGFTHSVQKTPVEEYFVVRGPNDILMQYTRYQSLGVGLPFLPSEGTFTQTDDGHFIFEMNRPFQTVKLRIANEAKPRLFYSGKEIPLCKVFKPGSLVEIIVEKRYRIWFN